MFTLLACIENEVAAPEAFDSGQPWDPPGSTEPDSDPPDETDSPPPDSDPTTTWIDSAVDSGGSTTEPYECPELLEGPWEGEALEQMSYAEDFAFESDGSVVLVDLFDLVRIWPDGSQELVFPMIGSSRGILPIDGDCYAISVNDVGEVQRVCTDGSRESLVFGVQSLGIALDDRRRLYYDDWTSKGIGWVHLDTLEGGLIESGFSRPDGVVWSATDRAVYFVQNDPPRLMRFKEEWLSA